MKIILIVSILLTLISGHALAGSEYDNCIKVEKALKAKEAGDCSGLRQLLNPSGCYATQRALKEYEAGKCRQIGLAGQVDISSTIVTPENKDSSVSTAQQKQLESESPHLELTLEQLKDENALLKSEVRRLKTENAILRKSVPQ